MARTINLMLLATKRGQNVNDDICQQKRDTPERMPP